MRLSSSSWLSKIIRGCQVGEITEIEGCQAGEITEMEEGNTFILVGFIGIIQ